MFAHRRRSFPSGRGRQRGRLAARSLRPEWVFVDREVVTERWGGPCPARKEGVMSNLIQSYRLGPAQGDGSHPYINKSGAFLGPDIALLARSTDRFGRRRFQPRSAAELEILLVAGFGRVFGEWGRRFRAISRPSPTRSTRAISDAPP
jgi:hypothetical protein